VFATLYTEKIVQIPISLPVLTQHDAEAYVALLLAGNLQITGTEATAMVERASERPRAGTAPYVVPDEDGTGLTPTCSAWPRPWRPDCPRTCGRHRVP
jgi:hypothetical protein